MRYLTRLVLAFLMVFCAAFTADKNSEGIYLFSDPDTEVIEKMIIDVDSAAHINNFNAEREYSIKYPDTDSNNNEEEQRPQATF